MALFRHLMFVAALTAAGASQAQVTVRGTTTATATTTGIQFRAAGTVAAEGSGDTNPDPTIPAGTVAGDILICVIESRDNVAHTMPAGWTQLSSAVSGTQHNASVFWKRAVAGEPAPNIGHPGGNAVIAQIVGFSGVDAVTAFDVANSFTAMPAGTSVEAAAITTVTGNAMLVMTQHIADNWNGVNLPTGNAAVAWNQAFYSLSGSGRDAGLGAHFGRAAAAGLQAVLVSTRTSGGAAAISHGAQIALRPALFAINTPALTTLNDVMIAAISVSPSTASVVAPAGWTLVQRTDQATGTSSSLLIYRRVATSAEPASHGWNIAAGSGTVASAVAGVAGSITSFVGVDTGTPVDAVTGASTASSSTHTAPALTTTVSDTLVLAFFEYGSSGTWSTPVIPPGPATMTLRANVSTLAVNNAAGVSLGIFSNPQAAIGGSSSRVSTASGANADTGAAAMLALRPTLQPPVLQWTMDQAAWNGTAGEVLDASGNGLHGRAFGGLTTAGLAPAIAGNPGTCRYGAFDGVDDYAEVAGNALLDVTDELTVMAWIRPTALPAAGNLKSIFSKDNNYEAHLTSAGTVYWWWGGTPLELTSSGAVTLNAWTHVAIVYSRAGGFQRIYLNGVQDPAVNNQSAALTTNGMPFQVGADQGFAGRNFAGSIDEVHLFRQALGAARVQSYMNATRPCPAAVIDHFSISHGGSGVACQDQTITITAHNASHAPVDANGTTVSLSTTNGRGSWTAIVAGGGSLVDATAGDGAATYTFAGGAPSAQLSYRYANLAAVSETFGFNVSGAGLSESTGSAVAATDDPAFTMAKAGFQFRNVTDASATIPTQLSGKPSDTGFSARTIRIHAIRTDTTTGSCAGLFASQSRAVEFGAECNSPASCAGRQARINATNIATSNDNGGGGAAAYTAATLAFNASSEADTVISYPDAGQISLHVRYDSDPLVAGYEMTGSSNAFVVRPFGLAFPGVAHSSTAAGAVLAAAGINFSMTVTAYQWASGEDANDDGVPDAGVNITDNGTTPNYAATGTVGVAANLPGIAPGAVTRGVGCAGAPTLTIAAGTGGASDWCYSEAGNALLTATAANYLGSGQDVTGSSALDGDAGGGYVGRFHAKDFAVSAATLTNRPAASCTPASTFTYLDEGLRLAFTLTARNAQGATTRNYAGAYAKLNPAAFGSFGFGARSGATNLTPRLDTGLAPTGTWSDGIASVAATTGVRRPVPDIPDGPFAGVAFGIAPVDSDGVAMNVLDLDVDNNAVNDHKSLGAATELRFGQLRLHNVVGSAKLPLRVRAEVQYWNGSAFIVNSQDNCTTLAPNTIALGYAGGSGLVSCETAVTTLAGAPVTFAAGAGTITLAAPGAANTGTLLVTPQLRSSASGSYCTAVAGSFLATVPGMRNYLLGRRDDAANPDADASTGYDDNPFARVSFGVYGAQPGSFIFYRENY